MAHQMRHSMFGISCCRMTDLLVVMTLLLAMSCSRTVQGAAGLWNNFYRTSCPQAEKIVFDTLRQLAAQDHDLFAVLLRLHFHDCFVGGCEASVLLEGPESEMKALPNKRLEGFAAVDSIKAALEQACPGVVSCADILAYAARDSVQITKGPDGQGWPVKGGRRDGFVSSKAEAEKNLPGAEFNVTQLVENFARKGLSKADMVVLSGAHTIGEAACIHIDNRIYYYGPKKNGVDPSIPKDHAEKLKKKCREPKSWKRKFDLDTATSDVFDSKYFENLVARKGLLVSDQVLYDDMSTRGLVLENRNREKFFASFALSMIKMSEINPLTGTQGEIRRKCSAVNK